MTLDFELDYGGRTPECNTLLEKAGHRDLRDRLDRLEAPLSAFVQTSLLEDYSDAVEVLKTLAVEVHSHSHDPDPGHSPGDVGFAQSLRLLSKHFPQDQYGYRAPFGKLYPGDVEKIRENGFAFDASLFPSFRPGKFNNLGAKTEPHRWDNGLLELPFAVMPFTRLIIGVSYMKLFGPSLYRWQAKLTGLPRVLVFYAHPHDWFPTNATEGFSPLLRAAFNRNKNKGLEITERWLQFLKDQGYTFVTMNELAGIMEEEGL